MPHKVLKFENTCFISVLCSSPYNTLYTQHWRVIEVAVVEVADMHGTDWCATQNSKKTFW